MNLDSMLQCLQYTGHFGRVVSTEETLILYNSLLILQNENHFRKIYFWGKILGTEKDYFIAYGYIDDALLGLVYYYSTDCTNWGLLPQPTKDGLVLTPFCTTMFEGDPTLIVEIALDKDETLFDEDLKTDEILKLKEEDRLAAVVHTIMFEAAVVPRGGLFKRPDGVVVENMSFGGLSALEAREIVSFLHYRVPTQKYNTNLLTRDDYNFAMDFLDPLDIDIPEGCWINHIRDGKTLVVLKSLYWPGFYFYHRLNTPHYGFVYFGDGKKCNDLVFMLSPFV